MPSQSTLTTDEKNKVKAAIPASSNKILFATLARIYYAYPDPQKWAYAGLQGALACAQDIATKTHSFRLVDLTGTRGVLWEHEMYDGLEFNADRSWFHSFEGDKCMIGFVYADEKEAKSFWKKVKGRKDGKAKGTSVEKKKKTSASKGGKITKGMISAPSAGSFVHVAHMGYDDNSGFVATGVDPSWTALLGQLENSGIDRSIIDKEMEYIKTFVRDHQTVKKEKKPKPPPPPSRSRVPPAPAPALAPAPAAASAPPPPPPPRSRTSVAPQPPQPPSRPSTSTPAPPPPPARPVSRAPTAPPPPARPSTAAPVAPPPPARPAAASAGPAAPPPPPPPPPPPMGAAGAPPPPPPPPPPPAPGPGSGPGPAQPGRAALLESIQGKGVHSLKKVDPDAQPRAAPRVEDEPSTPSGGADLTATLVEALILRNKKLGEDSDDEDEDEEEWD